MEQLLFSLNATIPVFLVMVIGYVLQQLHVTNDSFVKTLNSFPVALKSPDSRHSISDNFRDLQGQDL